MMQTKKAILALACVLSASQAFAQNSLGAVYKWTDAKGVVHYGDHPASSVDNPKNEKALAKSELGAGDDVGAQKKLAGDMRGSAEQKRVAAESDKSAKEKADAAKARDAACQSAKEAQRIFASGGRISSINEKGEKYFLDDSDIQAKSQESAKAVEDACSAPKEAPSAAAAPASPASSAPAK